MKLTLTLVALLAMTTAVSAQTVTANTIVTSSTQTLTIDPIGNGNVRIMDSVQVQGNITATQTISTSQAIQTTGTGSINSAYNLTGAGGKFSVAGDTGNVRTNGTLTVNGQTSTKGIYNDGLKITGVGDGLVAAGSQQAVNGGQLNNTNVALANETTARTDGDLALTARIEAEIAAREAGDVAIRNQVVASEARTVKVAHQSGALAMAVAGMTGAAPTGKGATAVSMGVGTFGGETAIAVGVSHAVNDAVRIFGSVTKVSGGDTGAAIGGSYSF
jgi:autotransporter adhesin